MKCPQCNNENRDTAKFCNECGNKLETAIPAIVNESDIPSVQEVAEGNQDELHPDKPIVSEEESESLVNTASTLREIQETPSSFLSESSQADNVDGFDFSPIEIPEVKESPTDEIGIESVLVDGSYEAPQSAWSNGSTMKMPKIDGAEPEQKKEFKATEQPEKKKMSGGKKAAVAVLLVLVLLCGGGAAAAFIDLPDGTNLADAIGLGALFGGKKVPDVTSLNKSDAEKTLKDQGFEVKVMEVKSDEKEESVLMTDPRAGARLPEGETVVLQVAVARMVPDIVGTPLDQAQAILGEEGLDQVVIEKEKSNEDEGIVLGVTPEVGQKVVSTSEIVVKVAEPYKVPDVVGRGYPDATAALEAEGYHVTIVYVYNEQIEGTVVSTNPAAGTALDAGSSVTMSVAKSRASELVALTQSNYAGGFTISGTSYSVVSIDSAQYMGNDTVSCLITCSISYTTPTGETLTGETKQRAFVVSFDSSNNSSIAAS